MRNNIKTLRKEAGLRQEDLAKQIGASRQTIIAIENDKYNPTLELAMKLAKQLGKNVEEIFFLDWWESSIFFKAVQVFDIVK